MRSKHKIAFRIGEREKQIIELIGLGTLVIGSLVAPNLPVALQTISKIRGNRGLRKFLRNLENKNIIYMGGEKIRLTRRGKEFLRREKLTKIKIQKPPNWNGVWWLISYDIPKKLNKQRDNFRFFLKRLGFYQIQASLWVYPYFCKEEIAVIAREEHVSPYVIMMATDNLSNQKEIEEHFGL